MAAVMIQGCGSDVGKSTLVAGLCRLFARQGLRVRPFKAQNMSNNAAIAKEGGEIGRAQALQARACGIEPSVDMNPVLLKPESDRRAQVILRGQVLGTYEAGAYEGAKRDLLHEALASYRRLAAQADLVIVEGAGSPAETNLRARDIANMGFAAAADLPVALIGDIERGHVIAALAGAHLVLDPRDRARIEGFIVNKFRGDPSLFDEGRTQIAAWTGWQDLGLIPWLPAARRLPSEDGIAPEHLTAGTGALKIAIPMWPRIANGDDLDALFADPHVAARFVPPGQTLPHDADWLVLPGSKATRADLAFARAQGWDFDILAHHRRGGRILGLCGGYQMLGRLIDDPLGLEGDRGSSPGLGLLAIDTILAPAKRLGEVAGTLVPSQAPLRGYEIHLGVSQGPDADQRPFARLGEGRLDGARSADGRVLGTYVHGALVAGAARQALFGLGLSGEDHDLRIEAALDDLADGLARHLDLKALAAIAGL